jgi:hypothetical protein
MRRMLDFFADGAGQVERFRGWIVLVTGAKIERVEPYFDATKVRAAAECRAQEQGRRCRTRIWRESSGCMSI